MTEPKPGAESFARWISIIHRYGHGFFNLKLAAYGIGSGHMPFIYYLAQSPGLSQDRLSELTTLDKTTTTRAVKKLIELGYIRRETDPADRRRHQLYLTPACEALIPRIKQIIGNWNRIISRGLTIDEKDRVGKTLEQMAGNARASKNGAGDKTRA